MNFSSGIVTSLSKQALEDVIVRFTSTHVHFIKPTEEIPVLFRLSCSVKRDQVFNEYKMEGYSEEENEIWLRVNIDHLRKAVMSLERNTILTIKLDPGSPTEDNPFFLITLGTDLTTVASRRIVTHQVPVKVIAHRKWVNFADIVLPQPSVSSRAII